jgi:hypothetical protein
MKMIHSTTVFAILISVLVACSPSAAGLAAAQTQGSAPAAQPSRTSSSGGAPREPGMMSGLGIVQGYGIMLRPDLMGPGLMPYCPVFGGPGVGMMAADPKTRGEMMQIHGRMMKQMGELMERRGKEIEAGKQ